MAVVLHRRMQRRNQRARLSGAAPQAIVRFRGIAGCGVSARSNVGFERWRSRYETMTVPERAA
jgi:hypothetical protein